MKKIIKKLKEYFVKVYVNYIFFDIKYKYLDISKDKILLNYIENKAKELAKKENIPIINVLFKDLNKNELNDKSKAVGVFKYLNKVEHEKYNNNLKIFKELNVELKDENVYPRIEITEFADAFVILHELGHYFIYKRNQTQSEISANEYIEEFFDNHLPPFFKWIFQIEISVRVNKKLKYKDTLECYNYYKKYKEFKKNYKYELQ